LKLVRDAGSFLRVFSETLRLNRATPSLSFFFFRDVNSIAHVLNLVDTTASDTLKLVQEPRVVLIEQTNVIDLVTNHRDAFDPEAERPA
jgi:hypothetical protein